jgi:diacylglycerol kinase (CTP)
MELTWTWERGVNPIAYERPSWLPSFNGVQTGGWWGLFAIAVVAGLVTGIAEALDLSLDDNFTLPVISGGCLFGFFKLSEWLFS